MQVAYAQKMIVVPGYGMAVAQAQHQVRELADLVEKRGGTVKYAIHPVAGRMPGHMNVLLAEANVPYDQLYEMDEINDEFDDADVCLVIGANDVVNPAARHRHGLADLRHADHQRRQGEDVASSSNARWRPDSRASRTSCSTAPRTWMLFGDAKQSLQKLITEVKQV